MKGIRHHGAYVTREKGRRPGRIRPAALCATPLLLFALVIPAVAQEVVITAVGDIMLGGSGARTLASRGYDYPFAATRTVLKNGDVTVGNLEAPITARGTEFRGKRFRFRTPAATAAALRKAGISVVTLANNHIMDYGGEGLAETLLHLRGQDIAHTGAGHDLEAARKPASITVGGQRIAFLAYSLTLPREFFASASLPGTAPGLSRYYRHDIGQARKWADHVVVSFHWGREGARLPQPYQREAAHAAIDAGADVVLGHHPHTLHGVERYGNGIILYSLGNFTFGSMSATADRSVIARITLDGGVKKVEIIPINVRNSEITFQPQVLTGARAERVIAELNARSAPLGSTIRETAGRYEVAWGGGTGPESGGSDASSVRRDRSAGRGQEGNRGSLQRSTRSAVGAGGAAAPDVALHR